MLTLEIGQKAKAIKTYSHAFKDGEIVEFIGMGIVDHKEPFYSYLFTNGSLEQELEVSEFILVSNN